MGEFFPNFNILFSKKKSSAGGRSNGFYGTMQLPTSKRGIIWRCARAGTTYCAQSAATAGWSAAVGPGRMHDPLSLWLDAKINFRVFESLRVSAHKMVIKKNNFREMSQRHCTEGKWHIWSVRNVSRDVCVCVGWGSTTSNVTLWETQPP